jgi:hypothetical protein
VLFVFSSEGVSILSIEGEVPKHSVIIMEEGDIEHGTHDLVGELL